MNNSEKTLEQLLWGIDGVIFDMDGTLMDSMWLWTDLDVRYLARFQLTLPPDLQKKIEGMSFTETACYFKERFALPLTVEQIKADWMEMAYELYATRVPLKPGAGRFLEELKRRGIATGIATSNGTGLVKAALKSNGVEHMLDCVRTACEVNKGKPAPDIYLSVADSLGVEPHRCLVFEDIPMGVLAGLRAGMRVCAVRDEFSLNREEELRQMAHYYIRDFEDIFNGTYEVLV